MATRCASSPCATRRGAPKRMRSTSACSSTSKGRPPSRVTVTTLPGAGSPARARKIADGLRTSRSPCSVMWKNASSPTEPKRFLVARTLRKRLAGIALEIQHRVDQVLEHARSGDGAVLGHVADDHHAHVLRLGEAHQLRRALAQLRHGAGRGAHRGKLHGLDGVDDQQPGALLAGARQRRLEVGVGDDAQTLRHRRPAAAPARRSAPRTPRPRGRAWPWFGRRDWPPAAAAWTCRCPARRLAR